MVNVLYIHGMGGGSDSRIPSILCSALDAYGVRVVVRTYDFDPEVASGQISSWVAEISPSLIIGESLGALHAIRVKGIPHILVSPAINAPLYFSVLAWLVLIPGVTCLFDRVYRPREGDRQPLHFTHTVLKKYRAHRKLALLDSPRYGSNDVFHAFFGTGDHYRKSGVVSLKAWEKYFGKTYQVYDGTHFMEEDVVLTQLLSKILELLNISK